jgi:hypothetical protein
VAEPLSTYTVPAYGHNNFKNSKNFNCALWTYIMYIYSPIYFKDKCEPEDDLG